MFRSAASSVLQSFPSRSARAARSSGRYLSTASPAHRPRSWKSSAARWALAIGAVYYYNTSAVFAETPAYSAEARRKPTQLEDDSSSLPTIEQLAEERRQRSKAAQAPPPATDAQKLEEEAGQEGAFNPETGEINWDCPCLGGMAHGPCGEEFKAAFSCFVYSNEEPKGMDCIDKFKGMQDCFLRHPDVYAAQLDDDSEVEGEPTVESAANTPPSSADATTPSPTAPPPSKPLEENPASSGADTQKKARAKEAKKQVREEVGPESETDELVPKAWHDTRTTGDEESK